MKKILWLLISIVLLQGLSLKAQETRGFKKIRVLGEEVRRELEKNLAIEFENQSDVIFGMMIVNDISVNEKRFQANTKVDLMQVLDYSMNGIMITKIEDFLFRWKFERSVLVNGNIFLWNRYKEIPKKIVDVWPHSREFKSLMEKNGLVYFPMVILRDVMKCNICDAEVSDLQEKEGTLPEYCHKFNCKYIEDKTIKINAVTDSRLSVPQRIKFALANSSVDTKTLSDWQKSILEKYKIDVTQGKISPQISLALGQSLPKNILRIITGYSEYNNLFRFLEFYEGFSEIRGLILFEEFIEKTSAEDKKAGIVR